MKFLLAALGVAALAISGWIVARVLQDAREWREILAYADAPPGSKWIGDSQRIGDLLRKRYPNRQPEWGRVGTILHLAGPAGEERLVIFHDTLGFWMPEIRWMDVSVLDGDRRDRSGSTIFPGRSSTILGMSGSVPGAPVPWCFEMSILRREEEESTERHYYALLGDRPVLLRLEDAWGMPRPNGYGWVGAHIGEDAPKRTAEEWERALDSEDLAEVLRTLLWLGGGHGTPDEQVDEGEESEQSRRAHPAALARPVVRARVAELRDHRHPWVSQAAAQLEIAD